MYQNLYIERRGDEEIVHLWDDKRGYYNFMYQKYAYIKNKTGQFQALDGTRLKKIAKWGKETEGLYESDVRPETRTLVDLYHESDTPSEGHTTMFFDIEVSIKGGYPNIMEADKEVISIGYHLKEQGHSTVLILDESGRIKKMDTPELRIMTFKTEKELLNTFIDHINHFKPTILSGWNSDEFDIPYMYRRMVKKLGKPRARRLSPIGVVIPNGDTQFRIAGISSLDYMRLYKIFTQGERTSYSLNAISNEEIGRGKVQYDGTLEDLYRDDVQKFIDYNLEDVILIRDIDLKMNFIALAQAICHKGHVPYENIHYTSVYLDGAALTFMKRAGVIAPNRKKVFQFALTKTGEIGDKKLHFSDDIENIPAIGKLRVWKSKTSFFLVPYKKYSGNVMVLNTPLKEVAKKSYNISLDLPGAFVQEPETGLYKWVYDLDLTSLYPSEIMSLNISPETKVGRIIGWDSEEWVQGIEKTYQIQLKGQLTRTSYTYEELKAYLDGDNFTGKNFAVAANGVYYRQDIEGFIPTILKKWFGERKEFKNKRDAFGKAGDDAKYKYFDIRQHTQKILLNSFYGVLALSSFRFYDVDNAEAITSSGQQIIKFTKKSANAYYQRELGTDSNYVIYIDTDSIFCSSLPLIRKYFPEIDETSDNQMTEKSVIIASQVQDYINKMYDVYAQRFHNIKGEHRFDIKQEIVSKAAFWVAKKRYAQLQIYKEGVSINKLAVTGIDTVRADFPSAFKTFFTNVLNDILKEKTNAEVNIRVQDFKNALKDFALHEIMFPTGIKDVAKYDVYRDPFTMVKGATAHAKSSLYYNDFLNHLKLPDSRVSNGDKIKWAYLKTNPYNMPSLAVKETTKSSEVFEYIEKYIDRDKMFNSKIKNKLDDFYKAMNWEYNRRNVNKFFSF